MDHGLNLLAFDRNSSNDANRIRATTRGCCSSWCFAYPKGITSSRGIALGGHFDLRGQSVTYTVPITRTYRSKQHATFENLLLTSTQD